MSFVRVSGTALVPMADPNAGGWNRADPGANGEAFVTFGRGILKQFEPHKDFGFISPIFRSEDSEGPPLNLDKADGIWFFGNHSLPRRAVFGAELTFEIWENSQGKSQARNVQTASDLTIQARPEERTQEERREQNNRRHVNEPKVIYPSVYVSDVPVEYTESMIRDLHRQLGLNPDTIMGIKYLPFTEVSLGTAGDGGKKERVAPVTGAVIIRYVNDEAANAAVERLKGHPIRTSQGVTKHLGAKHAAPAKWVMQRRQDEEEKKKHTKSSGESIHQKVKGNVARVSMSGYGVIKSPEYGEVMWRQYELPMNVRTMQFADPDKFRADVEKRVEYKRLKQMEGADVEAELYKLPDGQIRAWHVRSLNPAGFGPLSIDDGNSATASNASPGHSEAPGMPPPGMGPPGMPPPGMGPPGMPPPPGMGPPGMPPPGMDPMMYQAQMMQMMQMGMMGKKEKKKDKKDKKEKKRKREGKGSESEEAGAAKKERGQSASPPRKRREIDDDDF